MELTDWLDPPTTAIVFPLIVVEEREVLRPRLLRDVQRTQVAAELRLGRRPAALLQELADRWTVTLRRHADHWAAVYPMTWRSSE